MSYNFVHLAFKICLFGWFPLSTVVLILLMRKALKKLLPKLDRMNSFSVNGIATRAFFYAIPGLLIFLAMQVPLFYFAHQKKQYNYCIDVVRINKITDTKNEFLNERCSQFDLNELLDKTNGKF